MSTTFSSMIKLFLFQCLLTMILALPFQNANAAYTQIKSSVNSYLFEGEEIDLKDKLRIEDNEELKVLNLRAQGIENNAKLELIVNGKSKPLLELDYSMKTLNIAVSEKITSLSLRSAGAFLRTAKAIVHEGDQPHPEDIGLTTILMASSQLK